MNIRMTSNRSEGHRLHKNVKNDAPLAQIISLPGVASVTITFDNGTVDTYTEETN